MEILTYLRHQWDRVAAWACIGVGAIVLLAGWFGVSREVLPAAQLPYIVSGGLGGIFLLGLGAVLLLSADLRDEWRQLHEIAEAVKDTNATEVIDPLPAEVDDAAPAAPSANNSRRTSAKA